jgi:hypothetical protein
MVEFESVSRAIYGFARNTRVLELRVSIRKAAPLRFPLRVGELALPGGFQQRLQFSWHRHPQL